MSGDDSKIEWWHWVIVIPIIIVVIYLNTAGGCVPYH
jgi:hypothetical protein